MEFDFWMIKVGILTLVIISMRLLIEDNFLLFLILFVVLIFGSIFLT